jgi:hypothetical protein
MVAIRFQDAETEKRAIGMLIGRFTFKSFADGLNLVPPGALTVLATQGLKFTVEGQASYERSVASVRDSAAVKVQ